MTKRCDFYIGRGADALYLGSISHDAYIDTLQKYFSAMPTEEQFRESVSAIFKNYHEASGGNGWPWPWRDSFSTGMAIAWDAGHAWFSNEQYQWVPVDAIDGPSASRCEFPDMHAAEEATTEGRIRLRMQHTAHLAIKPEQDVIKTVLTYLPVQLSRMFMHTYPTRNEAWTDSHLWHNNRARYALQILLDGIGGCHRDFDAMLATRNDISEAQKELMDWFRTNWDTLQVAETKFIAWRNRPSYFGQLRPVTSNDSLLVHGGVVKMANFRAYVECQQILTRVLDANPAIFAGAMVSELRGQRALPNNAKDIGEWIETPSDAYTYGFMRSIIAELRSAGANSVQLTAIEDQLDLVGTDAKHSPQPPLNQAKGRELYRRMAHTAVMASQTVPELAPSPPENRSLRLQ